LFGLSTSAHTRTVCDTGLDVDKHDPTGKCLAHDVQICSGNLEPHFHFVAASHVPHVTDIHHPLDPHALRADQFQHLIPLADCFSLRSVDPRDNPLERGLDAERLQLGLRFVALQDVDLPAMARALQFQNGLFRRELQPPHLHIGYGLHVAVCFERFLVLGFRHFTGLLRIANVHVAFRFLRSDCQRRFRHVFLKSRDEVPFVNNVPLPGSDEGHDPRSIACQRDGIHQFDRTLAELDHLLRGSLRGLRRRPLLGILRDRFLRPLLRHLRHNTACDDHTDQQHRQAA
jgi:hypothetical protein